MGHGTQFPRLDTASARPQCHVTCGELQRDLSASPALSPMGCSGFLMEFYRRGRIWLLVTKFGVP